MRVNLQVIILLGRLSFNIRRHLNSEYQAGNLVLLYLRVLLGWKKVWNLAFLKDAVTSRG